MTVLIAVLSGISLGTIALLHTAAAFMMLAFLIAHVYLTTAVDWDGDGHRDIWNNRGDVAASIGNYLQDRGWRRRRQ